MARQFLIGELGNAGSAYTAGKLADTALEIEVLDVSNDEGPIIYNPATMLNPDMFRIVQGTTTGPNVYSNWINPKNVIVFDGSSAETSTHCEADLVISGSSTLAAGGNGVVELKFVKKGGEGPEEFFNMSFTMTDSVTPANQDIIIQAAYEAATKPDWLHKDCSTSGDEAVAATGAATLSTPADGTVTFFGNVPGATTTSSGNTWDGDAVQISVIVTTQNDITGSTYTPAVIVNGDNGVGTYDSVKKFEDKMKGIMYGYYNRRSLPNTPDNGAVVGSTYDMITIVATKDGSAMSGQIHGVDNLDEIFIAGKAGVATIYTGGDDTSFVEKLNALFPSMTDIAV
tara:strand:- start:7358 stop:8383 length:1026 start_codon:yes stop_codon:yes gene_type:complete